MRLVSAGAARTVTGSCHLIEIAGRRILVDCGLFQGPDLGPLNRAPFPFEPDAIDHVLVTHGHLDHVGRLPLLVGRGYAGPIHATRATRAIADVILLDSGEIQREDYERALRKAREAGRSPDDVEEPLYLPGDVAEAMTLFREVPFDESIDLGGGVTATFRPAGHILGSAFVVLEGAGERVVASGDLGNRESAIHADAAPPPECDAVLVETTYGDRAHRSLEATVAELRDVVRRGIDRGGLVLIPTYALERTQHVLYHLKRLMDGGEIPEVEVFLDSPMATRMTRLYETCAGEFAEPVTRALERGEDPFHPESLSFTATREESMRINDYAGCAIVLAGSGMMTGGRILHHLLHHLWKEEASLVVVGYQAEGTLGRRIVDGARTVEILGKEVDVRADVTTINGFSAHADRDDLLAWLAPTGDATAYLVHGEPPVMEAFAATLAERGREAVIPRRDEPIEPG